MFYARPDNGWMSTRASGGDMKKGPEDPSPYTKVLRFPGTAYYCPAPPGRGGSAES